MDTDAEEKGGVFYVSGEGTKLIINDSSNGNGKIMGGCAAGYEDEMVAAGVTAANKAVVEFNNGNITGNHGAIVGAVAAYNGGTFIMNGGKITQNNGMMAGAAFVYRDGTFTMNGGEITTNVCVGLGTGGIYDLEGGTVNLNGGKIHSNTGVANGGIIVSDENATLNISGSPIVENNYTSSGSFLTDVVVGENALINVTGNLTEDARLKVMSAKKPTSAQYVQVSTGLVENGEIERFISSDPNYIVVTPLEGYDGIRGEAYLTSKVEIRFYADKELTEEIREIATQTAVNQYIKEMPNCPADKIGMTFDYWTVKEQIEGTGDYEVKAGEDMIVNLQYVATDEKGQNYIQAYANWREHDHNHVLVEGVPATCNVEGVKEHYICLDDKDKEITGCKKLFVKDMKEDGSSEFKEVSEADLRIPMTEHNYGTPTYEWAPDYSTVTARKVCVNEGCTEEVEDHIVEETRPLKEKTDIQPPTCEKGGVMQYVSEKFYKGFEQQIIEVETGPLNHIWKVDEVKDATCEDEGYIKYICEIDNSHTKTETIKALGHEQVETRENEIKPTCTAGGSYLRIITCSRCGNKLSENKITVPAAGHDWGEWTEINDETGHFLIRACKRNGCTSVIRVDIPNAQCPHTNMVKVEKVKPTCTNTGVKDHLECESCHASFVRDDHENLVKITEENYKDLLVIPATGHAYGEPHYEWNKDNSSVTATRICANDTSHIESVQVEARLSESESIPATCSSKGQNVYQSSEFDNEEFEQQSKTVETEIDENAHEWGDWTEITPATCEHVGEETRVCMYNAGHVETRIIPRYEHEYNEPTYEWSEDLSSVTAEKVCKYDVSRAHVIKETAGTVMSETKAPTCSETGEVVFTAEFINKEFKTQSKSIETQIDSEAHSWSDPSYEWTSDNSTVTARRICTNNSGHIEEETVNTTSSITKFPTLTEPGEITFMAIFANRAFSLQTKTENIAPIGKKVNVALNGNGGTLDSEAVTVKYQFNYGSLPTPEKSDRVFEGWYTTSNFEDGTKVTGGSIVRNSEDHVLYARYQIPVTFVDTDNQTLMVSYAFEDQPTGITAPSKKPGKEGYTFMCWADASGQEYDFTQPVTKPVTLKPKFFQYRYIGNENIWYLGNVGVSTFTFKRYEFMISERVPDSDKVLGDNFKENGEKAYVDGWTLDTSSFTYANGSLILNLKDSYLNKLSAGRHTLRVDFTDGTAMADFTVIERIKPVTPTYIPPKTGN